MKQTHVDLIRTNVKCMHDKIMKNVIITYKKISELNYCTVNYPPKHNIITLKREQTYTKEEFNRKQNELKTNIFKKGFDYPVIINNDNVVIDGNHRVQACENENINIPTVKIEETGEIFVDIINLLNMIDICSIDEN